MSSQTRLSPIEKQVILQTASKCLDCDAPECHEVTPEGVDVCAELPFVDGKPITRQILLQWQGEFKAQPTGQA